MTRVIDLYFTSNQESSRRDLGVQRNPYVMIESWGIRLRNAMGNKEILSRNQWVGGELRPPTFRSYCEALDRSPWTCYGNERSLFVLPYNTHFDGWKENPDYHRAGVLCKCVNSYEFAYQLWDERTHFYHPDLLDNGTFGVWMELLPEPASVELLDDWAKIQWNSKEPRVHRSDEMGRYSLSQEDCFVEAIGESWRIARAEAYVKAWEKMASNEPADRYESKILAEQELIVKDFSQFRKECDARNGND